LLLNSTNLKLKFSMQAFKGEGQMLGNPTPSVVQTTTATAAAAPADLKACEEKAKSELNVTEAEPTTNVQVIGSLS
jgi:hypothetical protein